MTKKGQPPKKEKEEKQVKPVKKELKESKPFNLENELKKEKMYLQAGFTSYVTMKGYIVDTKAKYVRYMKEYKEA